jgi:hypothetical protein
MIRELANFYIIESYDTSSPSHYENIGLQLLKKYPQLFNALEKARKLKNSLKLPTSKISKPHVSIFGLINNIILK